MRVDFIATKTQTCHIVYLQLAIMESDSRTGLTDWMVNSTKRDISSFSSIHNTETTLFEWNLPSTYRSLLTNIKLQPNIVRRTL